MKPFLVFLAGVLTVALAAAAAPAGRSAHTSDQLVGAGSSLVAPLVSQWASDYPSKTGVQIVYSPIGSGGGIAAISGRTVDFGASDAPLTPDQAAACKGCVEIPWGLSATTLSYNVKGIPNGLRLSGPVIAGIFLGTIKSWDAPALKRLNPKLNLPSESITPVYRSDGSGDTYAFTDFLSHVSATWKKRLGTSTQVSFPTGVGGKGNSGVAGVISRTDGSIGYISDAYVLSNHLRDAAVKNAGGKFVVPGISQIEAAALAFPKVPANNEMHIVNPPKSATKAYPISTYTYVIVPRSTPKAALLRRFIFYALTQGQKFGPKLIFAHIPTKVLAASEKTLKTIHS